MVVSVVDPRPSRTSKNLAYAQSCRTESKLSTIEQLLRLVLKENRELKNEIRNLKSDTMERCQSLESKKCMQGMKQKFGKLCTYFFRGQCKFGAQCRNNHKRSICKFDQEGRCKFNDRCFNIHIDNQMADSKKERQGETSDDEELTDDEDDSDAIKAEEGRSVSKSQKRKKRRQKQKRLSQMKITGAEAGTEDEEAITDTECLC